MIHNGSTIETSDGIKYNLAWCLSGMNKFEKGSKEYEIFLKTFTWICRKASRENYDGEIYKL
jgi:hypothetical protein